MNFRDEAARGGNTLARTHGFAHARQFVERGLREAERAVVGGDDAAVDLHEQGFQFVAQIAHGHQARHARAALERVQRTLQRVEAIDAGAVLVPLRERALRLFDELDGLIGEDAGDVRVEIREDVFRTLRGARLLPRQLPAERKREAPRPPARQRPATRSGRGWRGGQLGGASGCDDALFEIFGGLIDARQQRAMRLEEAGGLVEMRGDGLHGVHAVGEQIELRLRGPRHCRKTCAPNARAAR